MFSIHIKETEAFSIIAESSIWQCRCSKIIHDYDSSFYYGT